jgi:hypothetical protein
MASDSKIKFNEYFNVEKELLDEEGLFNISLISDLPLFIDPFHLFYSKKAEYQKLHSEIIKYLVFLRETSSGYEGQDLPDNIVKTYYKFPEVKQNWFGFSYIGNSGRGLGRKFAKSLNDNFKNLFRDFGIGQRSYHLEKLTLVADRVGKDSISDFTTNLIHGFLAEKTQNFTQKFIDKSKTGVFIIKKAEFDYSAKVWKPRTFILPKYNGEYILLTPRDLLTKNNTWINKEDFIKDFEEIPLAMDNDVLRHQLSEYLKNKLKEYEKKKLNRKTNKLEGYQTAETKKKAVIDTVREFPQSIDVYIKIKENQGDEAEALSREYVSETESLFENQFYNFAKLVNFNRKKPTSYVEARERALYFKECVELHDCYLNFYNGDEPLDEEWIQRMFWLVWYGSESDVNRDPSNGLGKPDFVASQGKKDKTIIEFKLAKSGSLDKNIANQLEKYKEVAKTEWGIWVIVFFTYDEHQKIMAVLEKYNLQDNDNFILVDARKDNKIAPSKIK